MSARKGRAWVFAPPRQDAKPMVGLTFGDLTVLEYVGRRRTPNSTSRLMYRCRCSCGAEVVVAGACLRVPEGIRGATRRCMECHNRRCAEMSRARSTPVGEGKTLASVAAESGVALNTVTQRWLRGWPVDHLGDPVGAPRPATAGPSRKRGVAPNAKPRAEVSR